MFESLKRKFKEWYWNTRYGDRTSIIWPEETVLVEVFDDKPNLYHYCNVERYQSHGWVNRDRIEISDGESTLLTATRYDAELKYNARPCGRQHCFGTFLPYKTKVAPPFEIQYTDRVKPVIQDD